MVKEINYEIEMLFLILIILVFLTTVIIESNFQELIVTIISLYAIGIAFKMFWREKQWIEKQY
jgi:phosphatidylserine synthase